MAKLGELGAIITGNTPKTSEPENYSSNDICFVKPSDISDNEITYLTISEYYISEIARNTARIVPPGSILVTCIGIIGKVAINQVECAFNQQINAIVPNGDKCLTEYLAYAVQWGKAKMQEIANAPVVPILNKTQFSEIEVKVPSLSEQRHVATVLNKVCNLIALRKQQLAKLDELVKARFVELFGDYRINEKGFDCKKGSELFKFSSGKFLPEEKRLDEGVPVYGGNGIAWYTSECLVDYPTIIIGRVGAQCGNIHAVTTPVWITDNAIYIKEQKTKAYTLEFLTELMRMMDFYQYADFSGQPKITQKPLETLDYIMPPIELQTQFATFVEQTDKSKVAVQKALDEAQLLFDSLMQKYFG